MPRPVHPAPVGGSPVPPLPPGVVVGADGRLDAAVPCRRRRVATLHVDGAAGILRPVGMPATLCAVVRLRVQPGQVWRSIPSRAARRLGGVPRRLLVVSVRSARVGDVRPLSLGPDRAGELVRYRAEVVDLATGSPDVVSVTPNGHGLRRYELASDPNVYRVVDADTGAASAWGSWTDLRRASHAMAARRPAAPLVVQRTIPAAHPLPSLGHA